MDALLFLGLRLLPDDDDGLSFFGSGGVGGSALLLNVFLGKSERVCRDGGGDMSTSGSST